MSRHRNRHLVIFISLQTISPPISRSAVELLGNNKHRVVVLMLYVKAWRRVKNSLLLVKNGWVLFNPATGFNDFFFLTTLAISGRILVNLPQFEYKPFEVVVRASLIAIVNDFSGRHHHGARS